MDAGVWNGKTKYTKAATQPSPLDATTTTTRKRGVMIFEEYRLIKVDRGYVIENPRAERINAGRQTWAFSTLKEVQEYLPELMEQQND